MLPDIKKHFVLEAPRINQNDIISFNMGIKSSTGEKYLRVKTSDRKIFIKKFASNGMVSTEYIEIPPYSTSYERDEMVIYLSKEKKLTQDDIADYMSISQSTVSNILRKYR